MVEIQLYSRISKRIVSLIVLPYLPLPCLSLGVYPRDRIFQYLVPSFKIMGFVFVNAREYNSDVLSWDVFNVDYTSSMFYNAQEFNDGVLL